MGIYRLYSTDTSLNYLLTFLCLLWWDNSLCVHNTNCKLAANQLAMDGPTD